MGLSLRFRKRATKIMFAITFIMHVVAIGTLIYFSSQVPILKIAILLCFITFVTTVGLYINVTKQLNKED